MSTGTHAIKIQNPDYKTVEEKIKIDYQQTTLVKKTLTGLPATLLINSIPQGGNVSINGKAYGITPLAGIQLEPGKYQIQISMRGYQIYSDELNLSPNQKADVNGLLIQPETGGTKEARETKQVAKSSDNKSKKKTWTWIGIGVGIAVAAGIAYAVSGSGSGGGGGGSGGGGNGTGSIPINW